MKTEKRTIDHEREAQLAPRRAVESSVRSLILVTAFLAFGLLTIGGVFWMAIVSKEPLPTPKIVERWCEIGGDSVRYSNTDVPGYQRCGAVSADTTCDPVGRRFIGSRKDAPYSYLECTGGPRIRAVAGSQGPWDWLRSLADSAGAFTTPTAKKQ